MHFEYVSCLHALSYKRKYFPWFHCVKNDEFKCHKFPLLVALRYKITTFGSWRKGRGGLLQNQLAHVPNKKKETGSHNEICDVTEGHLKYIISPKDFLYMVLAAVWNQSLESEQWRRKLVFSKKFCARTKWMTPYT